MLRPLFITPEKSKPQPPTYLQGGGEWGDLRTIPPPSHRIRKSIPIILCQRHRVSPIIQINHRYHPDRIQSIYTHIITAGDGEYGKLAP